MVAKPVATSDREFEPDVKMSAEEFNDMMLDIAHVTKSKKVNRPVYDEEGNFIGNSKMHTFIIKNEDLAPIFEKYNIPHVDWDNPNMEPYQSETNVLKGIEELTGYNSFPYSREMYMISSQNGAKSAVANKTDPIDELKRNLKVSESEWHRETGVEFDKVKGKNYYKDDVHMTGQIRSHELSRGLEAAEQISSMYHDNAYVQLLYEALKVYDEYKQEQVNDIFASRADFLEKDTKYDSIGKSGSSKSWNKGNIANFMNDDESQKSSKEGSFEPK